ncbi:MAG: TlpA family protein disulfide reductase [Oligoflexia bacterium]|nr:TlpA family protein disulfide reductase [Oligoflexia bacterium]
MTAHLTRWQGWLLATLLVGCQSAQQTTPDQAKQQPAAQPKPDPTLDSVLDATPPAGPGAGSVSLVTLGQAVAAVWIEPAGDSANRVVTASWTPQGWTHKATVIEGPQVASSWADHPDIATDGAGRRVVSWLQADPGDPGATQVAVSRESKDGWVNLGVAHADQTPVEHGFAALGSTSKGVVLTFLDGRQTPQGGPMQLRSTILADTLGPDLLVDPMVCDCCRVDAVGSTLVYRDRTDDDVRDIVVRSVLRDGAHTTTFHDGWVAKGCPVNGPAIDSAINGNVDSIYVAWYTEAPQPMVQVAVSVDGAATFGEPIRLDGGKPQGRVDIAALDHGFVLTWVSEDQLHLRRGFADNKLGVDITVGPITHSFPSIARYKDGVLLAWQQPGDPAILTARYFPLNQLDGKADISAKTALAKTDAGPVMGPPFPSEYAPRDLQERPAPLAQWAGQPVLINLWATWCPPCMQELPELHAVNQAWSKLGLKMISIAQQDQVPKIRAVANKQDMSWVLLQDSSQATWDALGLNMLPTTLVYGRDGTLLYLHIGPIEASDADLMTALHTAVAD